MTRDKINLGKYNLNEFPVNPFLLHKIQDKVLMTGGIDLLSDSYRRGVAKNPGQLVKTIWSDYQDNPSLTKSIVGEEVIKWVIEYLDIDPDDLPKELFTKPD